MKANFAVAHGGGGNRPIALAVKFRLQKKRFCSVKEIKKYKRVRILRFDLPDRVLYMANGVLIDVLAARKEKFDDFLLLDPWQYSDSCDALDLRYFMGNFIGDQRKSSSSLRMVWDSGGLQIARQKRDFIDPSDIAKCLTDNKIFAGVSLDLLVPKNMDRYEKMCAISSKVQRLNTKVLKEESDGVNIYNVVHGYSQNIRKIWTENSIVDKRDLNWCLADLSRVAGLSDKSYFLVEDIKNLEKLTKSREKLKLHLLGVATHKFVVVLIPISSLVDTMTADATTALMASRNGIMILPTTIGGNNSWYLGKIPEAEGSYLPCGCRVCRMVGNSWVYSKYNLPLAFHNMAIINDWSATLTSIFNDGGMKEYLAYLRKIKIGNELIALVERVWDFYHDGEKSAFCTLASMEGEAPSFRLVKKAKEDIFSKTIRKYLHYHRERGTE